LPTFSATVVPKIVAI